MLLSFFLWFPIRRHSPTVFLLPLDRVIHINAQKEKKSSAKVVFVESQRRKFPNRETYCLVEPSFD
jgi:hypothetical protein